MAVTVDDLVAMTADDAGFALLDVGLFLDGPDGTTKAILGGIYRGLLAVGVVPADPLLPSDPDAANLSGAACIRVSEVAALHALRRVLGRWHFAVQSQCIPAVAKADDVRGGWLWEEKQALQRRVSELEDIVAAPFVDPLSGTVAVFNREPSFPCCWPYGGCD